MLFSKTIVGAIFFALASNVFAAPFPIPDGSLDTPEVFSRDGELILNLQRRAPVPTVDEMEKHIRVPKDKALFYSGDTGSLMNDAYTYAQKHGLKVITELFQETWAAPWEKSSDAKVVAEFWDNISGAMAKASSGTVHVLLPTTTTGTNWKSGTVWDRIEWPLLKTNSQVHQIIRVNPTNSNQEVIHP
jgi:hypothetical protein